jgi:hypothetical protein
VRHFIVHTRRASHGSARPLNCGVMRLVTLMRDPQAVERFVGGATRWTPKSALALICLFASYDVHSQQLVTADIVAAQQVVEQLRDLPTPLPHVGTGVHPVGEPPRIPPSEVVRDASYRELHRLGPAGVTALARAYRDADVRLRRNAALAFLVLAQGIWPGLPKLDVRLALPELTTALRDDDPSVRAWSAQAIGMIGADARTAVPALIRLLADADEGSRNSACIALRGVGPAATSALPALRRALSDSSEDVRGFARRAILAIEGEG